jgi:hypothetical protein
MTTTPDHDRHTTDSSNEEFISEPIIPAPGTADTRAMGRGEPGLPKRFTWRDEDYAVVETLASWKSSAREGGVGELYLRRHWYKIRTDGGERMTLYCERQARSRARRKMRWFLYSREI